MVNKVYSLDYQKKVLRRLERQGSISGAEKIAWLTGIYVGKVTKLIGLGNIDFVTNEQEGLFNIANTVHETQTGIFLNLAKKVKNQNSVTGIQIASEVGDSQKQILGIQARINKKDGLIITNGLDEEIATDENGKGIIVNNDI